MKTRIVRIGNSQGIRIPKPLIAQAGLGEEVELRVQNRSLIVRSLGRPRAGWDEAFKAMAERGDDAPLDGDLPSTSTWDETQWQWK